MAITPLVGAIAADSAKVALAAKIQQLEGELHDAKSERERALIDFKVGDACIELFRISRDPEILKKARGYLEPRFQAGDVSLVALDERNKLASCLTQRDFKMKRQLLNEVIHANPQKVIAAELTPELVEQISAVHPSEVVPKDSNATFSGDGDYHSMLIEKRLASIGERILDHYKLRKIDAMLQEIYLVSREEGIRGLQRLLNERKDFPEIEKAIQRELESLALRD